MQVRDLGSNKCTGVLTRKRCKREEEKKRLKKVPPSCLSCCKVLLRAIADPSVPGNATVDLRCVTVWVHTALWDSSWSKAAPSQFAMVYFFFFRVQYIKTTLNISLFSVLSQKVGGRGEGKKCVIVCYKVNTSFWCEGIPENIIQSLQIIYNWGQVSKSGFWTPKKHTTPYTIKLFISGGPNSLCFNNFQTPMLSPSRVPTMTVAKLGCPFLG